MAETVHHLSYPGAAEIFALINLVIVVLIIYFGGRRSISAAIKNRTETITKQLLEVQFQLEKTRHETVRAHHEVSAIEKSKEKLIEEVREEGVQLHKAMVLDAKASADRILADAKMAAYNEVRQAVDTLKQTLAQRVLESTATLTTSSDSTSLKGQLQEKFYDQFVTEAVAKGVASGGVE